MAQRTKDIRDQATTREEALLAALPARSRRREVWTGIFVLVGILAVLTALFTLTNPATFRGRYIVTTVVSDAGGIRRGDPVQMLGVNIGRVHRFRMAPEGVAVQLELEGEYEVPRDSRVVLRSSGIMGGVVADIVPGRSEELLRGRDLIPGARAGGFLDLADDVGAQASDILDRVRDLLTEETLGALGEGTEEFRVLLGELNLLAAEQRSELAELAASLNRSAEGVERVATGPELERVVARLDAIAGRTEEVTASLGRVSSSLEVVLDRLERGEGTLGRLSMDDELYENVNRAALSLDELLKDLKENPSRYFKFSVF